MIHSARYLWVLLVTVRLPSCVHGVYFLRHPRDSEIVQGQNVELHCDVEDRRPWQRVLWAIRWDDEDGLWRYIHITGGDLSHIDISQDIGTSHFVHRGSYSHRTVTTESPESRDGVSRVMKVENYTLGIQMARHLDSGVYMCAYWPDCPTGDAGFNSKAARVTVLLPKNSSSLTCNSLSPQTITRGVETKVILQCTATDELAHQGLSLFWFREDGRLLNPHQEASDNVFLEHVLQADENGLRFYCEVDGPHGRESCSNVPLNVPPTLSLTPAGQTVYEGTDAVFTCTASGMPYIHTFIWYVDYTRTLIRDSGSSILVDDAGYTSSLRLKRVETSTSSKSIVCVAAVPSGVSANATARLMVKKAERLQVVLSPDGSVFVQPSTSLFFACSVLPSELTNVASFLWFLDGFRITNGTSGGIDRQNINFSDHFPSCGIWAAGSAGGILRVDGLEPSDQMFNITCQVRVPNLKADFASCQVSVRNTSAASQTTNALVTTVSIGAACFVLGLLSASLLFILCSRLWRNPVTVSDNDEQSGVDEAQGLSLQPTQVEGEQLFPGDGPERQAVPSKESDRKADKNEIQHTYFSTLEKQDSDHCHLGMQENPLSESAMSTYEQLGPAETITTVRPTTLPHSAARSTQNTKFAKGAARDLDEEEVRQKFVKLPKWPPVKDEGYEMPRTLARSVSANRCTE